MPIYEYQCNQCGERVEFIQKFSENPKKKCPECGKPALKKLVSAAAFHLKGDGWYVTDFRDKDKEKKENGKDGEKVAKADKSDGGKDGKKDTKVKDGGKSSESATKSSSSAGESKGAAASD